MARAIWKGSISFGLVSIPIEVHTAVRDHRPRFRCPTRKTTAGPVQRCVLTASRPGRISVRGRDIEGPFVVLTKEDFKTAAVEKTRTIDVIDFVKGERSTMILRTRIGLVPEAAQLCLATRGHPPVGPGIAVHSQDAHHLVLEVIGTDRLVDHAPPTSRREGVQSAQCQGRARRS